MEWLQVGDWGRDGQLNQTEVAQAMARIADEHAPSFIISTGDNFYESGLLSVDDTQFTTSFTDVYNSKTLHRPTCAVQVPWFAVLGNHVPTHPLPLQLDIGLWKRDHRWHCARTFERQHRQQEIEIFFIDTNPAIEAYQTAPFADNKGGIKEQSWDENLRELTAKLAASQAKWKVVVGHHPVRYSSSYALTTELLDTLEPVLEQYRVDAYFSGHEHNLQYLHREGSTVHYFVSGGGSQ
eukprot:jgi/Astpho2/6092/gw1.00084.65.1_t